MTLSELTKRVLSSLEITIALIGSGDVASKMSSRLDSYFPSGFLHLEILNILPSLVPENDIEYKILIFEICNCNAG